MKKCSTCKQEFPETLEFFPPNKECRNGINPECRKCKSAYHREWKKNNRERLSIRRREIYAERYSEIQKEKHRKRLESQPLRVRASIMRQGMLDRSRKRNIPFDADVLTIDYMMHWIKRTAGCPCCGKPIDYGYKDGKPTNSSPSIDRIRPELGYVVGNVALLCWRCNNLKRDATADELESIARWMRSHEVPPESAPR